MEITLIIAFGLFILWLGTRILDRAGMPRYWVFALLIPVVNIIMIWIFAFSRWPNTKPPHLSDNN